MSDDPQKAPAEFADEGNYQEDGHDGKSDKDTSPAAPGDSDTPAGDTDQHSDADA